MFSLNFGRILHNYTGKHHTPYTDVFGQKRSQLRRLTWTVFTLILNVLEILKTFVLNSVSFCCRLQIFGDCADITLSFT